MMDIDAMGIPDPEGHHRHIDGWRSNDGKTQSKAASYCPIWVYEDQASYRNITYERGPRWLSEACGETSRTAHGL
jgi:hypothetical protein